MDGPHVSSALSGRANPGPQLSRSLGCADWGLRPLTGLDWLGANDQGVLLRTSQPAEGAVARRREVAWPQTGPHQHLGAAWAGVGPGFSRAKCPAGGPEVEWRRPGSRQGALQERERGGNPRAWWEPGERPPGHVVNARKGEEVICGRRWESRSLPF